ncbi:NADH:ubiquinone oxidoreductase, partial [Pseudomonas syringae pv. tagetis]
PPRPATAPAEPSLPHTQPETPDPKVRHENINNPPNLFHDSFSKPQLAGQKTETTYSQKCPAAAYGVCRKAQVANLPYSE